MAACNGHIETMKYLIENGADIHRQCDKPLRNACINGHIEIVKYLIGKGAVIYFDDEKSALMCATQGGHIEVVKYLIGKDAIVYTKVLVMACQYGHIELVKYFIKLGVDIHAHNEWSLRISAKRNHLETLKYLIEKGADIHADKDSALRDSVGEGHTEIMKYLIENGADISVLELQTRLDLELHTWETKPENITFRKNDECPISKEELNDSEPQLGCSQCLNNYKKEKLEQWLNISFKCPLCQNNKFYLYKV
jgi:ankyrin repeat protein